MNLTTCETMKNLKKKSRNIIATHFRLRSTSQSVTSIYSLKKKWIFNFFQFSTQPCCNTASNLTIPNISIFKSQNETSEQSLIHRRNDRTYARIPTNATSCQFLLLERNKRHWSHRLNSKLIRLKLKSATNNTFLWRL